MVPGTPRSTLGDHLPHPSASCPLRKNRLLVALHRKCDFSGCLLGCDNRGGEHIVEVLLRDLRAPANSHTRSDVYLIRRPRGGSVCNHTGVASDRRFGPRGQPPSLLLDPCHQGGSQHILPGIERVIVFIQTLVCYLLCKIDAVFF